MNKIKNTLNVEEVNSWDKLFKEKGWINDRDPENKASPFNKFCDLLSYLSTEERGVLFQLSFNYTRFGAADYTRLLNETLHMIDLKQIGIFSKIWVMPLIAEKDRNNFKSGHFVAGLFQEHDCLAHPALMNKDVNVAYKYKHYMYRLINDSDSCVFLVDDFMGTGETSLSCLAQFNRVPKNRVFVIALVALEQGVNTVRAQGWNVVVNKILKRGISDTFCEPQRSSHVKHMQNIEAWLEIEEVYKFGYKGSEALVTMLRTPDNTFPIFWRHKKIASDKKIGAPFYRHE